MSDQRGAPPLPQDAPPQSGWKGLRAPSTIEAIQCITVDPDTDPSSEGAPEWLVTNGLGGYASGTVTGLVTRRFHGFLVAALPAPRGRTMMLNQLDVITVTDGGRAHLSEQPDPVGVGQSRATLLHFRLELGLPVWRFEHQGHVIEKRIIMPHRQNTVLITFERLSGNGRLRLLMIPWIHFRPHEGSFSALEPNRYALRVSAGSYEIEDNLDASLPPLRIKLVGESAGFALDERCFRGAKYPIEQSRGYDASGDLYSPGQFSAASKPAFL